MVRPTQQHIDTIAGIYDAVIEPAEWVSTFDQMAETIQAKAVNFILADSKKDGVQISTGSQFFDDDFIRQYHRDHAENEAPAVFRMQSYKARNIVPVDTLFEGLGPYVDLPTVKWLRESRGIGHRYTVKLSDNPAWIDLVTLNFAVGRERITTAERETVSLFLPHLANAVELTRPFQLLKKRFDAVLSVLNRFHIGVFVMTGDADVVIHNVEAERIVDLHPSVQINRNSKLVLTNGPDQNTLQRLIRQSAQTSTAKGSESGSQFAVKGVPGQEPLLVEVSPIRDRDLDVQHNGYAIVMIVDPSNRTHVSLSGMQALFDLTQAEHDVFANLVEGLTAEEIAEARNTSVNTVRSQMKSLFNKTDTRRQAELIRLALSINLPIDDPHIK